MRKFLSNESPRFDADVVVELFELFEFTVSVWLPGSWSDPVIVLVRLIWNWTNKTLSPADHSHSMLISLPDLLLANVLRLATRNWNFVSSALDRRAHWFADHHCVPRNWYNVPIRFVRWPFAPQPPAMTEHGTAERLLGSIHDWCYSRRCTLCPMFCTARMTSTPKIDVFRSMGSVRQSPISIKSFHQSNYLYSLCYRNRHSFVRHAEHYCYRFYIKWYGIGPHCMCTTWNCKSMRLLCESHWKAEKETKPSNFTNWQRKWWIASIVPNPWILWFRHRSEIAAINVHWSNASSHVQAKQMPASAHISHLPANYYWIGRIEFRRPISLWQNPKSDCPNRWHTVI